MMVLVVIFTGCSIQKPVLEQEHLGCGASKIQGNILFTKKSSSSSYCALEATFTNTSQQIVKPEMEYIFLDNDGNTLGGNTQHFSEIAPGKYQKNSIHVRNECGKIKSINIIKAKHSVYDRQAKGYWEYSICGIDKTTHTFQ